MNLTQRLKEAEQERRRSAGLPVDDGNDDAAGAMPGVLDLTRSSTPDPVIDLTSLPPFEPNRAIPVDATGIAHDPGLDDAGRPSATPAQDGGNVGIAYDPVRSGDSSTSFGDHSPTVVDRASAYSCPRCGAPTQIDLIDQVHQTVSLSCKSCFHMFRIEQ